MNYHWKEDVGGKTADIANGSNGGMPNQFTFSDWAAQYNLKGKTLQCLQDEDLDDLDTLKLLSLEEVDQLGITRGQKLCLKTALEELQTQFLESPPNSPIRERQQFITERDIKRNLLGSLQSNSIKISNGPPAVYQINLHKTMESKKTMTRKCSLVKYSPGCVDDNAHMEKTILVVGATGVGKSTIIDSLTNYILGVRREDPFRFKVVNLVVPVVCLLPQC